MSSEQQSYHILIVCASDTFSRSLTSLLEETYYLIPHFVKSISSAKQELSDRQYDFILINSPLPDDTGIRFAIDTCSNSDSVVLMLFNSSVFTEAYDQITPYGVLSVSRPVTRNTVLTAFQWMAALRERLRRNEARSVSLEEKMKEIRLVNRAKWLLISELNMDEPQAHRYIEKQAMDQCISKRQVAETIIRTYSI